LVEVVREAVRESGVDLRGARAAVIVGTGLREQPALEDWAVTGRPVALAAWDYEDALQRELGVPLPVHTLVKACGASLAAVALAKDLLALGQVDIAIAAGTDSIGASMFALLDRVNAEPPTRLEPFEASRKGVLMGEGAAAIVLRRRS